MNINNDVKYVLINEEELQKRIKELALQLSQNYENKNPVMICLLKGSISFFAHLLKSTQLSFRLLVAV